MEITPEIQKQLDEQKKQCLFCKIVSGEIDSSKTYEDKSMLGTLDINPAVKGHSLFLPKGHYPILPYVPPAQFAHLFGLLPALSAAMNKALLCTGTTILVANGAAAGQQAPHVLVHAFPREKGDKLGLDLSTRKPINEAKHGQAGQIFARNLPLMLANHFKRRPASWHTDGPVKTAAHLVEKKSAGTVVYEDEKALALLSESPQAVGHVEIYAQSGDDFGALSKEDAAHLFFVASYCATAQFETLGAQGTNLLLHSGKGASADGALVLHVLPRWQDDQLPLTWKPMSDRPDLGAIAKKIADKTFAISEAQKPKKKRPVLDLSGQVERVVVAGAEDSDEGADAGGATIDPGEEIRAAILALKKH